MKTSIHVTVDESLLKWVDEKIDDYSFSSRSHAVNKALMELKRKETLKL